MRRYLAARSFLGFPGEITQHAELHSSAIVAADLNGDGRMDLIKTTNEVTHGTTTANDELYGDFLSIVDYGRYAPAIDPMFGVNGDNFREWSSTSVVASFEEEAWTVSFTDGSAFGHPNAPPRPFSFRAVRSAP